MVPLNYFSSFRVPFRIGFYSLDCVFDLGLCTFRKRSFSPPSGDGGHHLLAQPAGRQAAKPARVQGPVPRWWPRTLHSPQSPSAPFLEERELNTGVSGYRRFHRPQPNHLTPIALKGGEDLPRIS